MFEALVLNEAEKPQSRFIYLVRIAIVGLKQIGAVFGVSHT